MDIYCNMCLPRIVIICRTVHWDISQKGIFVTYFASCDLNLYLVTPRSTVSCSCSVDHFCWFVSKLVHSVVFRNLQTDEWYEWTGRKHYVSGQSNLMSMTSQAQSNNPRRQTNEILHCLNKRTNYLQTTLSLLDKIAIHFTKNFLRWQWEIHAITFQNSIQCHKITVSLCDMMKVIGYTTALNA